MKILKVLMLACALTFTSTAFAQFANSGKSSAGSSGGDAPETYQRIGISYNNANFSPNKKFDEDSYSLNGVGIDYIHGSSVSSTLPLYWEIGANLNYGAKSESYDEETYKYQLINLQVPVNLVYRYAASETLAIMPYVGLNFKGGIALREKYEYDGDYYDDEDSDWFSFYSKDDVGEDNTFNRFQFGWHIGVGAQFSSLYVGLQYGTDFIPAYSKDGAKINTADLKVSLAYCF
jgi:hypothetical protein